MTISTVKPVNTIKSVVATHPAVDGICSAFPPLNAIRRLTAILPIVSVSPDVSGDLFFEQHGGNPQ
jgi:hypothetical protein